MLVQFIKDRFRSDLQQYSHDASVLSEFLVPFWRNYTCIKSVANLSPGSLVCWQCGVVDANLHVTRKYPSARNLSEKNKNREYCTSKTVYVEKAHLILLTQSANAAY